MYCTATTRLPLLTCSGWQLTYALGVLLKVEGWSDVNDALPWLVGSLGTIVFDVIIVVQCFIYGDAVSWHH